MEQVEKTRRRRVDANGANGNGSATAEIASAAKAMLAGGATERDLNANVEQIDRAKAAATAGYWELGQLIAENHNRGLWRLRSDGKGKAIYSSFEQFAKAELRMHYSTALKLASVATAFSRQEVVDFGATRLGLVLQVPEDARPRLLEAVRAGASKADLRDMAKGQSADTGRKKIPNRPQGRPADRKVTVAALIGEVELPLNLKPMRKGAKIRQAKVDDLASEAYKGSFASEVMLSGVTSTYEIIVGQDGELALKISRQREE